MKNVSFVVSPENALGLRAVYVIAKFILCGFAAMNFKLAIGVIKGIYSGLLDQI